MAIEYTWDIAQLDAYPEQDGFENVVFQCHWRLTGVDGDHTGSVYGTAGLTLDPEADFTPFAELTETVVIGWVKDAMGEEAVAAHEANVAAQIEALINPPVVRPALPWG